MGNSSSDYIIQNNQFERYRLNDNIIQLIQLAKQNFDEYFETLTDDTTTVTDSPSEDDCVDEEALETPELRYKLLQSLVKLIQMNEKATQSISGKDIVILLGTTGVGKSTTINYLCSKKMVQNSYYAFEKSFNKDVKKTHIDVDPKEKSITKIGHQYVSETTTLHICPAKENDEDQEEILFCDSPGFEDSEGKLIDFANSIGITKALRVAKSVKIFLIVSYDQLNISSKGDSIKKFIKLCSRLFTGNDRCKKSTFLGLTFLQNQENKDGLEGKVAGIDNALSNPKEKKFFQDFICSSLLDENKFSIIDPFNREDVNKVLRKIKQLQGIPQKQISTCFKYSISNEASDRLEKLLTSSLSDIDYFFENQKYESIGQILSLVSTIKDETKLKFIEDIYFKIIQKICVRDDTTQVIKLIQQFPQEENFDFQLFSTKFIKTLTYVQWVDRLRKEHRQQLKSSISFDRIQQIFLKALYQIYNDSLNEQNYYNIVNNLKKLKSVFKNQTLKDKILDLREKLYEFYGQRDDMNIQNSLEENLYIKLIEKLQVKFFQLIKDLLDFKSKTYQSLYKVNEQFQQIYQCIDLGMSEYFQYNCKEIYQYLQQQYFNQFNIVKEKLLNYKFTELYDREKFKEFIQIYQLVIETIKQDTLIKNHFSQYNIEQHINEVQDFIANNCFQILLDEISVKTLTTKKNPFILVKNIRNIDDHVFYKTQNYFLEFQIKIQLLASSYFEKAKNELKIINQIIQSSISKEKKEEEQFEISIKRQSRILSKPINITSSYNIEQIKFRIKNLKKFLTQIDDLSWIDNSQLIEIYKKIFDKIDSMIIEQQEIALNQVDQIKNFEAVILIFYFLLEIRLQNIHGLNDQNKIKSHAEILQFFKYALKQMNEEKCSIIYVDFGQDKFSEETLSQINHYSHRQLELKKYLSNLKEVIIKNMKTQFQKEFLKDIEKFEQKVEDKINECSEKQNMFKDMLLRWVSNNIQYDFNEITQDILDGLEISLDNSYKLQKFPNIIQICEVSFYQNLQKQLSNKLIDDKDNIQKILDGEVSDSFEKLNSLLKELSQNTRRFQKHLDQSTKQNLNEIKKLESKLEKSITSQIERIELMI